MQTAEVVDVESTFWSRTKIKVSAGWEWFKKKFSWLPVPMTPREMLIDGASTARTAAWSTAPFWWPIVKSFFSKIAFYIGVSLKTLGAIFSGTS